MPADRRSFLKLLSSGAISAAFPASIARALEIPAHNRHRSIADVEHIVVLEARFADRNPELIETNITPWRRAVAGDLTSPFNFRNPNARIVPLPSNWPVPKACSREDECSG